MENIVKEKMNGVSIEMSPVDRNVRRELFVIDIDFTHGDCDGSSSSTVVCDNEKEALAYMILLETGYREEDCVGYSFDDIVETFKLYVKLPENTNPHQLCVEFFKGIFEDLMDLDDNDDGDIESAITDLCRDNGTIVGDVSSYGWHYAVMDGYRMSYYDKNGSEFLVEYLGADWEDVKPEDN